MPVTTINGLPIPDDQSPNNPPMHFQALSDVLDTRLNARFATVNARNAAIPSPVDGMECAVAGYPQVYRAGQWHGIQSQFFQTSTADPTTRGDTADVMSVSVPDPGYPYRLLIGASILLELIGDGVTVAPEVRVNGTTINPRGANRVAGPSGEVNQLISIPTPAASVSRTGPSSVTLTVVKISGQQGYGFKAAQSSVYNILWAQAVPV